MKIVDSDMLHPDKSSGYQQKQKFDASVLKQVLPESNFYEDSIAVDETLRVNGFRIEQKHADVVVLYLGGADSHIDSTAKYLTQSIGSCPITLQMFDYRGYGRTAGEPTMDRLKQDALKIYDALKLKSSKKLVIHGYSMGSFIAANIAQQRQVDGIILEATASTYMALLEAKIPVLARPFFRFEAADSLKSIEVDRDMRSYQGKSLVIAGEKDVQTPPQLGKLVFDAIPGNDKQFILVPELGHSGLLRSAEARDAYCKLIMEINSSKIARK